MKTVLILLASILLLSSKAKAGSDQYLFSQTHIFHLSGSAPILGIGQPKYNKRKLTRKNTIGKTKARNKRLLRNYGIGMITVERKEPSNA